MCCWLSCQEALAEVLFGEHAPFPGRWLMQALSGQLGGGGGWFLNSGGGGKTGIILFEEA